MSYDIELPTRQIVDPDGRPTLEFIRWLDGFVRSTAWALEGTGTPEGAVEAPVGHIYRRTDGGASTTFYVKESGTGNTGWVAK